MPDVAASSGVTVDQQNLRNARDDYLDAVRRLARKRTVEETTTRQIEKPLAR
jgi:hypothetical protein